MAMWRMVCGGARRCVVVAAVAAIVWGGGVERARAAGGDPEAQRALVEGIRAGDAAAVGAAIKAGAEAMGKGAGEYKTAAAMAIGYGDAAVVEAMSAGGADWSKVDVNGWNALETALVVERTPAAVVSRMIDAGLKVRPSVTGYPALAMRAPCRNAEVVRVLVKAGYDPKETTADGYFTPLAVAAIKGTPDAVRALIEAGAKPRDEVVGGREAIHYAAGRIEGAAAVIAELKKSGADLDVEDDRQWTPLMLAIWGGSPETVRALLAAGASLEFANGNTALCFAAQFSGAETVKALIEKGADAKEKDSRGMTPLNWALRSMNPPTRMEWSEGRRTLDRDRTPAELLLATDAAQPEEMVRLLLRAGADPNAHPAREWAPLTMAVRLWDVTEMRSMKEKPEDRSSSDSSWAARVEQFAVRHRAADVVKMLVDAGAAREVGGSDPDALDMAAYRRGGDGSEMVTMIRTSPVKKVGKAKGKPAEPEGGDAEKKAKSRF